MTQTAAAALTPPEQEIEEVAPTIEVHRFSLADLEPKGQWLYDRLHPEYPDIAQNYIASWLRGAMESNCFLFLCSSRAVGLFERCPRRLKTQPVVEEVFNLTMDDDGIPEAQEIYRRAKVWAQSMDASEMHIGACTDLTQKEVVAALGPIKMKNIWTVKTK